MAPLNPPAAQHGRRVMFVRRRMTPPPLLGSYLNYILVIIFILLFGKVLSFLYTAHLHCAEHDGLMCWNTPPRITDLDISDIDAGGVSGRDIPPPCEGSFEDGAAVCRKVVDGVCVAHSCPEVDGVGEQNTAPPTEELSGTPTVDKASAWWWRAQRVQGSGAACTGACNPDGDGKLAVKRQFIGDRFPPVDIAGMQTLSSKPPPPATTTTMPQINGTLTNGTRVNGTPTAEIPLVTNIRESGQARGVVGGVAWNSCASSAALLGLVAIGVVVLL
ncbi:hypothetical protein GMDG_02629 [Pseudogymnoascus destructans 20631-21]|uniref:Uncharacterized protein n=1 Tax=Pseudogymnoascus destructans (strain ATCC MYA-4855 / 20631-21) TaxID=658429 RepID=L8G6K3_PSED2|nr:hypothetical protein GMDG_02629 [Pseudogymnoascus destructans 20631-21]